MIQINRGYRHAHQKYTKKKEHGFNWRSAFQGHSEASNTEHYNSRLTASLRRSLAPV